MNKGENRNKWNSFSKDVHSAKTHWDIMLPMTRNNQSCQKLPLTWGLVSNALVSLACAHTHTHTSFSNRQTTTLLSLLIEAVQNTTKAWLDPIGHHWHAGNRRPIIHPLLFCTKRCCNKLSIKTMLLINYSMHCSQRFKVMKWIFTEIANALTF